MTDKPAPLSPEERKQIQDDLRRKDDEMGALLDTDGPAWRRYRKGSRNAPPRLDRLLRAYRDGYRPEDWPTTTHPRRVRRTT